MYRLIFVVVLGCARAPAPVSSSADPKPDAGDCLETPPALGQDLDRPLVISPCMLDLEPPRLTLAARARAIETIRGLGPADATSLVLASDVAFSELAAIPWDGFDAARLRSTIALIAPIVDAEAHARSQRRDAGMMGLMCAHVLLGEHEQAQARGVALLEEHSGQWVPGVYLAMGDMLGEQASAIKMFEKVTGYDAVAGYASYRLAWTLRHPAMVDQGRAVKLLERLIEGVEGGSRLDRVLGHRAARELRALGREVEVQDSLCRTTRGADK